MKFFSIFISTILFFFSTLSAQNLLLKGRVEDKQTHEPLPFANVYVNNTTIGTSTNEEGWFSLKIPLSLVKPQLVVSYMGYRNFEAVVTKDSIVIGLQLEDTQLNEVKISSKKDKTWIKNYKEFEKIFLGNSDAANLCKIIRPWEISLTKTNQKLTARSLKPIEIENKFLGYKVYWDLKNFESTQQTYSIVGNSRFELLSPANDNEKMTWEQNRAYTYQGSLTHFFQSMGQRSLKSEGFNVYRETKLSLNSVRQSNFEVELLIKKSIYEVSEDSLYKREENHFYLQSQEPLEIHYVRKNDNFPSYTDLPYQVSWLETRGKTIVFDTLGHTADPQNIILSGSMSQNRVSELLPLNYQPSVKKTTIVNQNYGQEKCFLTTSKSYYHPKERIWVKAVMVYEKPFYQDSLSQVLYVDLIGPDKKIISSQIWEIQNGESNGDFILPESLKQGIYYLRAYTQWMRNFGDSTFAYKQIPILGIDETINVLAINQPTKATVDIKLNQDIFAKNDTLEIEITAQPYQSFSLAVTDKITAAVEPIPSLSFISINPPSIRFPIEQTLVAQAVTKDKKGKNVASEVSIVDIRNNNFSTVKTNHEGYFIINNLWALDTLELLAQAKSGSRKKLQKIILLKHDTPLVNIPASLPQIRIQKSGKKRFVEEESPVVKDNTMLEEVTVTATKNEVDANTIKIYGKADYVVNMAELQNQTSDDNLITFLQGRVPSVKIDVQLDDNVLGKRNYRVRIRGRAGFVETPSETGFSTTYEPLVLIDGVPFPNIEELTNIGVSQVDRIEVITKIAPIFGARGSNGVIAIYTKNSVKNNQIKTMASGYPNFQLLKIPAFSEPKDFVQHANNSSTLYWNPYIVCDGTGKAKLKLSVGSIATERVVKVFGIKQNKEFSVESKSFSVR